MSGNYYRKLSASKYHHAKNEGIIGILPYPKMFLILHIIVFFVLLFQKLCFLYMLKYIFIDSKQLSLQNTIKIS